MRFSGTNRSVPEIASELNVDALVEGSVFRAGDRVRITATLVRAVPEERMWVRTYERNLRDVLALHSEVARGITREIEAEVTPQEEERLATTQRVDPAVLEEYLQGRAEQARGTVAGFERAIDYYRTTIKKSPDFAPAHAAMALSLYLRAAFGGASPEETEPEAKAAAERALVLDESLTEARAVLAGVESMYEWDWVGAEREYRRAISLDPNSAITRQWYAYHLSAIGQHDDAIAQARRGLELDPLNPNARIVLADQFIHARRFDLAKEESRRALDMDPRIERARELLEWIATREERFDDAVAIRREILRRSGGAEQGSALAELEREYTASGPKGYWYWHLRRLEEAAANRYVSPTALAAVHIALGQYDQAVEWLEKAYREKAGVEFLKVAPEYDSLRSDARFQALLGRMNFPSAARTTPPD